MHVCKKMRIFAPDLGYRTTNDKINIIMKSFKTILFGMMALCAMCLLPSCNENEAHLKNFKIEKIGEGVDPGAYFQVEVTCNDPNQAFVCYAMPKSVFFEKTLDEVVDLALQSDYRTKCSSGQMCYFYCVPATEYVVYVFPVDEDGQPVGGTEAVEYAIIKTDDIVCEPQELVEMTGKITQHALDINVYATGELGFEVNIYLNGLSVKDIVGTLTIEDFSCCLIYGCLNPAGDISHYEKYYSIFRADLKGTLDELHSKYILEGWVDATDGKRYNLKITCPYTVPGSLDGLFSVGPNKKIRFAQSSIRYENFAHFSLSQLQYSYLGNDNSKINQGTCDLFGWGTGDNPTKCTTNSADYLTWSEWGAHPLYELGTTNILTNSTDVWRTLSKDEWVYILHERPRATELLAFATYYLIPGLIIMPDDSVLTSGSFASRGAVWNESRRAYEFPNQDCYGDNVISPVVWNSTWMPRGAFFLPMTGYRLGTSVYDLDAKHGCYWCSDGPGNADHPTDNIYYYLSFQKDFVAIQSTNLPHMGCAVRLAHDVQ